MAKEPTGRKRRGGTHQKTPADVTEAVFAHYVVTQNYSGTAKKFGMPISTVFSLVNGRAGGPEELERLRNAKRADLIEKAYRAAGRLVPLIKASNCGTVATSKTADASRAFESMVRASHLMEPEATEKQAPTNIVVYTGMRPPPELEAATAPSLAPAENVGPNTTSTGEKS
jgi:hypothetical protein